MIHPLQRLGNYLMFFGSILHMAGLSEISTVTLFVPLKYKMSILMLVAGSILSFRYDKHGGDIFSKSLGMNMHAIGVAYELHSCLTPKSYSSCAFGCLLVMGGTISAFLTSGKPPKFLMIIHNLYGIVFCISSFGKFYLNIFMESPPTIVSGTPGGIENACTNLSLAVFHFLDAKILQFIAEKRAEERNEISFRNETTMAILVASLLLLGILSMYIGSALHMISLFEKTTDPQIASFLHKKSVSLLITGTILVWGSEENIYNILLLIGLNMTLISGAYQIKNYFTTICYTSCVFGGFLQLGGHFLMFLKRKPSENHIKYYLFLGFTFIALGCYELMVDILAARFPEDLNNQLHPDAWINICIGSFQLLNSFLLKYLRRTCQS